MVGGQRVEGGSETDDDSLRRMKTNRGSLVTEDWTEDCRGLQIRFVF